MCLSLSDLQSFFYVACCAAGILHSLILGNTLMHEHGQRHWPGFKMITQTPSDVKWQKGPFLTNTWQCWISSFQRAGKDFKGPSISSSMDTFCAITKHSPSLLRQLPLLKRTPWREQKSSPRKFYSLISFLTFSYATSLVKQAIFNKYF